MYSKNGSLECITCLQIMSVEFAVDLGSCLHHKTPKNSWLCKAGQAVIRDSCFWQDLYVFTLQSSRVLRDGTHAVLSWVKDMRYYVWWYSEVEEAQVLFTIERQQDIQSNCYVLSRNTVQESWDITNCRWDEPNHLLCGAEMWIIKEGN